MVMIKRDYFIWTALLVAVLGTLVWYILVYRGFVLIFWWGHALTLAPIVFVLAVLYWRSPVLRTILASLCTIAGVVLFPLVLFGLLYGTVTPHAVVYSLTVLLVGLLLFGPTLKKGFRDFIDFLKRRV